jgi:hypothetical protein
MTIPVGMMLLNSDVTDEKNLSVAFVGNLPRSPVVRRTVPLAGLLESMPAAYS